MLAVASALGMLVAAPSVNYAVTVPGAAGVAAAFAAEALISCATMLTVLAVSNHARFARYTPLFVGALVATCIRCVTCDGFPCLVDEKSDADVLAVNDLLVEALERYHHSYGEDFQVECPTGSGRFLNLRQVSREIGRRLVEIFRSGPNGSRPWHKGVPHYANDPHWRGLVLFHEYFCGDSGRGIGASHQTAWTALVVRLIEDLVR